MRYKTMINVTYLLLNAGYSQCYAEEFIKWFDHDLKALRRVTGI